MQLEGHQSVSLEGHGKTAGCGSGRPRVEDEEDDAGESVHARLMSLGRRMGMRGEGDTFCSGSARPATTAVAPNAAAAG